MGPLGANAQGLSRVERVLGDFKFCRRELHRLHQEGMFLVTRPS